LERQKEAVLIVLGVDENGQKELLATEEGYRESTASWADVLRSLKDRGLEESPPVSVGSRHPRRPHAPQRE
jgi:putative transposase